MRGTDVQGRFSVPYETYSIWEGIRDELASPVGVEVDWYRWDQEFLETNLDTILDDTYDTSNPTPGLGRVWKPAVKVPVVTAQIFQGQIQQNDRGFYNTDTMRIVIDVEDAVRIFPDLCSNPDSHIKDRIVFRNEVFHPIRVYPRGHLAYNFAVLTIDCAQVNSEELVNDSQFQSFAGANDPMVMVFPPGAPRSVEAYAEVTAAVVSWDAPASNGGSAILKYVVATNDGVLSKEVMADAPEGLNASFYNLSPSQSYVFRVVAINRIGTGAISAETDPVIPLPEVEV